MFKISDLRFLILSFCICNFVVNAHAAQDGGGANAGITLRFSPSAYAAAMGDAFTAPARGVAAAYYNPAGLGWTREREISLMYQDVVLDVGQGSLGFASPLGERSAWAVLAQYVDFGTTQRTVVSGTSGAASGTFTGQDIAVGLSYGARMSSWGYGATAKVYSSSIDNATATAFAVDMGLRWQSEDGPLSFGATVRNLGTGLKYDGATERLPTTFRLGAGWQAIRKYLLITADLEKVADENWSAHAGAELTLAEMFSLRAGYDGSIELDNGFTAGAGFKTGGFELDYAFIPFGVTGNNHRVGLGYKF